MSEQERSDVEQASETTLYRPTADGGMEVAPDAGDYREQLKSSRWDAAPLENPEVEQTDSRIVVAGIILFGVITFIIIVAGYGSGLWDLPA